MKPWLRSCYFELFCNRLSSIKTRTVATCPCSRTSHLRLLYGSSWTKLQALCFHGKALSAKEALVEVLFDLYKQTTVVYSSGQFIRVFSRQKIISEDKPSGIHIADEYVYVSDNRHHFILVYATSGQCVTSFGRKGQREGEFQYPLCITSCVLYMFVIVVIIEFRYFSLFGLFLTMGCLFLY